MELWSARPARYRLPTISCLIYSLTWSDPASARFLLSGLAFPPLHGVLDGSQKHLGHIQVALLAQHHRCAHMCHRQDSAVHVWAVGCVQRILSQVPSEVIGCPADSVKGAKGEGERHI